jgi:shikimate kinase/3-dehydroquinate synthase
MPPVVISGPPGVGKSTAGRALAQRIQASWIDLDDAIAGRMHRTSAAIIKSDGEATFRAIEAQTLEELDPMHRVVSLGGGTLTTERGRRAARKRGAMLGLTARIETLEQRLKESGGDRPLLSEKTKLPELLEQRWRTYAAVDRLISAEGAIESLVEVMHRCAEDVELILADVAGHETRVLIGAQLFDAFAGAIAALQPTRPVLLLADRGVPESARSLFIEAVRAMFPAHLVEVDGGEAVKTWSFLGGLLENALAAGCGRQSVVAAIGGGAVCDLAALAASLLGRGAPVVLAPSTLLAQVDASIGGKCAVNMTAGRNLVGAFHPATDVLVDTSLLASLSAEEYRSGLAELLKIALILDPALFRELTDDPHATAPAIARAIRGKSDIVARDPFERGERKLLNLGHTLGHALESASGFTLRHGEAVAIGIAAIARYSTTQGWLAPEERDRIIGGLAHVGLPTSAAPELLSRSAPFMTRDKKGDTNTLDLVCIQELGKVSMKRVSSNEVSELVRCGGMP